MNELSFILPVAFAALMAIGMGAFVLTCHRLCSLLEERHLEKFEQMGRPGVMNQTASNSAAFALFLIKQEYRDLNDRDISKLANIIRTVVVAVLISGLLLFLMWDSGNAP